MRVQISNDEYRMNTMPNKLSFLSCLKQFTMPAATLFLLLLIVGDFSFVLLHMNNSLSDNWSDLFSLDSDGSYAEAFQYFKWLWIVILLIYISIKKSSLNYIAWALVFTYFLLDDGLQLHEKLGAALAEKYQFKELFGLRPQDFGELAITAMAGAVLFIGLAWAFLKGSRSFRKISYDLLLLIFFLVILGVGVDMLHSAIQPGRIMDFIFIMVEDAGEMIIASVMVWYVFILALRDHTHEAYLLDCIFRK